jgi:hypothetical protein
VEPGVEVRVPEKGCDVHQLPTVLIGIPARSMNQLQACVAMGRRA